MSLLIFIILDEKKTKEEQVDKDKQEGKDIYMSEGLIAKLLPFKRGWPALKRASLIFNIMIAVTLN